MGTQMLLECMLHDSFIMCVCVCVPAADCVCMCACHSDEVI